MMCGILLVSLEYMARSLLITLRGLVLSITLYFTRCMLRLCFCDSRNTQTLLPPIDLLCSVWRYELDVVYVL
jgi:hypothetical protein